MSAVGLTPAQVAQFNSDGYLLLPEYLSLETCADLLSVTRKMLADFPLKDHPMTRFSTDEKDHIGDDYFLTSNDKIRFFFEEDAFSSSGELTKPKEQAINKIGHFLHVLSPEFAQISYTGHIGARNAAIAKDLGFRDPRILQSMVICKQPEIGGAVPPHQDSTFLYTDPPSAVGFWIALEDATVKNGCLSFAKGSHKRSPVKSRFVRKANGEMGTTFLDVSEENAAWPRGIEKDNTTGKNFTENYTLGEVKAGTLVLIHGNLLHKSERNLSEKSRFIYTFHMIEGPEALSDDGLGWTYDDRNWLQPPAGGEFTKLAA
ncbi:MAG: hypothetical protein Q9227_001354 [Pyrenula ochraceoflavens]